MPTVVVHLKAVLLRIPSVAAESERTMSIIRTAKTFVLVSVNKKNNKI